MSTPTKQAAPVKAAPVKAVKRTPAPPIDFSGVTVAKASTPVKSLRSSAVDKTPVPGWVKQSRDNDNAPVDITIPKDQADHLKSLIRTAAARQDLGVRIESPDRDLGNGSVVVKFQTKDKSTRETAVAAPAVAAAPATA